MSDQRGDKEKNQKPKTPNLAGCLMREICPGYTVVTWLIEESRENIEARNEEEDDTEEEPCGSLTLLRQPGCLSDC
jgi:hypothetical protein